jgi:predicted alpha/beta-fold hydrolase
MLHYQAPRWLKGAGALGGNVQTIWPALYSHPRADQVSEAVRYRRERWDTPDGDFIDVDWLVAPAGAPPQRPLLVLFHGLEGSSQSHYARAFAHWAQAQGWDYVVPHFRGCSGEMNRTVRAYHSGDHEELDWILRRLALRHTGPMLAVGVSLGGNALLRWAQEAGSQAGAVVKAVVAISSPVDLTAAGQALGQGFNRHVYTRMFLRTLKPKALLKARAHPGVVKLDALLAARDLYEYDNAYTAPVHGFANTEDYWLRASAKPGLRAMRHVPALVLNARNDPFVPAASLPCPHDVGPAVTLWQPAEGGHVGFPQGRFPGHVADLPRAVGRWLAQHL